MKYVRQARLPHLRSQPSMTLLFISPNILVNSQGVGTPERSEADRPLPRCYPFLSTRQHNGILLA